MSESSTEKSLATATNPFTSVPIEITVCVGKARPLIRELVTLGENAVLTLDRNVEDPVELYVGDRLIAMGQLEEQDIDGGSRLLVRITAVVDMHPNS
jgi:flagellar motor switch protein FliN/FliY